MTPTQSIEAVYEHGVFRPVSPMGAGLAEGQTVRLVVEVVGQPEAILALAADVYQGLTPDEIEAIEQHITRRDTGLAVENWLK